MQFIKRTPAVAMPTSTTNTSFIITPNHHFTAAPIINNQTHPKVLAENLSSLSVLQHIYRYENKYRDFECGYYTADHNKYQAAWRCPWNGEWEISSVVYPTIREAYDLLKPSIDYRLVIRAMERTMGKEMRPEDRPNPQAVLGPNNSEDEPNQP